jgi:hypothetical protein
MVANVSLIARLLAVPEKHVVEMEQRRLAAVRGAWKRAQGQMR